MIHFITTSRIMLDELVQTLTDVLWHIDGQYMYHKSESRHKHGKVPLIPVVLKV